MICTVYHRHPCFNSPHSLTCFISKSMSLDPQASPAFCRHTTTIQTVFTLAVLALGVQGGVGVAPSFLLFRSKYTAVNFYLYGSPLLLQVYFLFTLGLACYRFPNGCKRLKKPLKTIVLAVKIYSKHLQNQAVYSIINVIIVAVNYS